MIETKRQAHEAKVVIRIQDTLTGDLDKEKTEQYKGAWGMPRLSEAKKDVTSCEKPERGANTR